MPKKSESTAHLTKVMIVLSLFPLKHFDIPRPDQFSVRVPRPNNSLLCWISEACKRAMENGKRDREDMEVNTTPRKPRVLLAASGSVAAIKFGNLCHCFTEWAEVRAVVSKSSLHFLDKLSLPQEVTLYTDEDEWSSWNKIGDPVLHIELRRWADVLVIAPLSANTLGKIAGGLCDNLLTCIIRAWDYSKPLFVAPAMNTLMWNNPFTERHLLSLDELGITLIPPIKKRLACGDYGNGAMAEPSLIYSTVRLFWESQAHQQSAGTS